MGKVNDVNGIAVDKMQRVIEETIGEEGAKKVRVESSGSGVSITYVAGKTDSETFTIDLEEADDGAVLFDSEQIGALQKKLGDDFDYGKVFNFGDLDEDTAKGVLQNSIDEFTEKFGDKAFSNAYLCIFSIIRIIQDCSAKLKQAAIAMRRSAMESEIQAIENQSNEEKSAAIRGLIVSTVVFVAQAGVTAGVGRFKGKAMGAHDEAVQNDDSVKLDTKLAENTMLLNDPVKADDAMLEASQPLQDGRAQQIADQLGGYSGKLSETRITKDSVREKLETELKVKSETSEEKVQETEKTEENAQKTEEKAEKTEEKAEESEEDKPKTEAEKQKEEYLKKLDDGVAEYKAKYDEAHKDYQRELKAEHPDQDKINELKEKCETARNEYVFANATRTAAISNGPDGEPLLDKSHREERISDADYEVFAAEQKAEKTPEVKGLWKRTNRVETISRAMDNLNTLLAGFPQVFSQAAHGNAILREGDRKHAEDDYSGAQETVEGIKGTEKKTLELVGAVAESWRADMQKIFS